jgi:anti-sigma-K factor RskA
MMDHEAYKELLPLQALSELDRGEALSVEEHLAACAECRAELDGWQEATASLAHAAAPLDPSPQVRDRILDAVRAEAASKSDNVVQLPRPASVARPAAQLPRSLLAIAALLLLALLFGVVALSLRMREARVEISRLSQELDQTKARLQEEQGALALLTTPGARMVELAGTKEAPGAKAMMAVDPKSHKAVLMARGLPQPPEGKAYQLWFFVGAKPMPGRVFKTDVSGNAMMMDEQLPAEANGAVSFAVTLEPQNGVSSPTGPVVLLTPATKS